MSSHLDQSAFITEAPPQHNLATSTPPCPIVASVYTYHMLGSLHSPSIHIYAPYAYKINLEMHKWLQNLFLVAN